MKISSIGVNNIYNDNMKIKDTKKASNEVTTSSHDVIEISSAGKSLSSLGVSGTYMLSDSQLEALRSQVSSGTYNRDSASVAKKIYDVIKGRGIWYG